jgi:hypothetical protein
MMNNKTEFFSPCVCKRCGSNFDSYRDNCGRDEKKLCLICRDDLTSKSYGYKNDKY